MAERKRIRERKYLFQQYVTDALRAGLGLDGPRFAEVVSTPAKQREFNPEEVVEDVAERAGLVIT